MKMIGDMPWQEMFRYPVEKYRGIEESEMPLN